MARTSRAARGGVVYHVINRGNDRRRIFHKEGDYLAFLRILAEGQEKARVELFGWNVLPNHWHLVLRPRRNGDLAAYLGWITNTHAHRYRVHYGSVGSGHLYQGRFKSFPVQDDRHFLTVLRYTEANAPRAGLAKHAEDWPWSSLSPTVGVEDCPSVSPWPVRRPRNWVEIVNRGLGKKDLAAVRACVARGRPFGSDAWVARTAKRLGL